MIPLVIAYDQAIAKYVWFSYDKDNKDCPILIQKQLDTVPEELKQYIVDYPVVSNESAKVASSNSTLEISQRSPPSSQSSSSYTGHSLHNGHHLPVHLRNLVIIDSTLSGSKKSSELYFSVLLPLLKAFGTLHVYVSTSSPTTISDHARAFSSSSTVVFLGGDTSIHEFVNQLPLTNELLDINIAAVPTGTGNALSNSIGHDGEAHAISRLFTGSVQPLSSFKVEFPPGTVDFNSRVPIKSLQSIVVFSWAFHAALVADSDRPDYRKLGSSRFQKAAQENLKIAQNYDATVKFSSQNKSYQLNGPHSYLLFTTMTSLEKTFKISPDSHPPSDTNIRIVQFDELPGDQIMEIMMAVYDDSKHVDDPRVVYRSVDGNPKKSSFAIVEININDQDPTHDRWCIDGRIVSVPGGQIRLLAPQHKYHGWSLGIIV
jgi:diacylglycerol kinase family enzyme